MGTSMIELQRKGADLLSVQSSLAYTIKSPAKKYH